jgi:uncharacterized protein YbjT (DUF2867 family)
MILDITGNGPLGVAVRAAVERATGEVVRTAPDGGDAADLFMAALGCRAIVCAAAPNLLEGKLEPAPSPERMTAIVRASSAPGVELVVVVVPSGERYADEERVLKRAGIPYVILRCAPLVEELADATNFHVTGSLWLARGKTTAIAAAPDLAAAVVEALREASWQGRTVEVASERIDLAEAVGRAARAAGARTQVRTMSPALCAVHDTLAGWLGVKRPPALALYEKMLSAAA